MLPPTEFTTSNECIAVDLLSLDVEGAEVDILSHFPLDEIRIEALIVECDTSSERTKQLQQVMRTNGYALVHRFDDVEIQKTNRSDFLFQYKVNTVTVGRTKRKSTGNSQ